MAAVIVDDARKVSDAATLSGRQRDLLSSIIHEIRTTVHHLALPKVNALSAVDATAVDALKDIYYMLNVEDPLNALPVRHEVFANCVVHSLLHPIITALHTHPSLQQNQKRWSVPTYQALRTLCVLSTPVPDDNHFLPRGCALDASLSQIRAFLGQNPGTLNAMVSLLQYYLERKTVKLEALSSAESCKLEDARIDNILVFFRNILSPPRANIGDPLLAADFGIHLALVAALYKADLYTTLSILFDDANDARLQNCNTIFLAADIYAHTFRHSTPKTMHHTLCSHPYLRNLQNPDSVSEPAPARDGTEQNIRPKRTISKTRSSALRTAILKERATLGGSRAVTSAARWTNRYSGGFTVNQPKEATSDATRIGLPHKLSSKRILSAKAVVQSKISFNPKRPFQEAVLFNSQVLCLTSAKGRAGRSASTAAKSAVHITKDLQSAGLQAIVKLTIEFVNSSFCNFTTELRDRIGEVQERTQKDSPEFLCKAQRSLLSLVAAVVGFQRESNGKVRKQHYDDHRPLASDIHQNRMVDVLSSDLKVLKKQWRAVEAGIAIETFKLAFRVLVESFEALKSSGKDAGHIETIEIATFAVLEMMKMLQGMAANVENSEDTSLSSDLTARELALNTLEKLFTEEVFLNTPADLAKSFNAKYFSFTHLTNIVELGYAFTNILLDEKELNKLQVTKKKRNRAKKKGKSDKPAEELKDGEESKNVKTGEVSKNEEVAAREAGEVEAAGGAIRPNAPNRNARRVKRVLESDDEEGTKDISSLDALSAATSEIDKSVTKPANEAGINEKKESEEELKSGSAPLEPKKAGGEDESPVTLEKKDQPEIKSDDLSEHEKAALDPPNLANSIVAARDPSKMKTEDPENDKSIIQLSKLDDIHSSLTPGTPVEERAQETTIEYSKSQKVVEMLRVDARAEAKTKGKENVVKTKSMLMADIQNEGKPLQGKLVTTIKEAFPDTDVGGVGNRNSEGNGRSAGGKVILEDDSGDESEVEAELCEIESIGIIRRFAHGKAIQNLILPVRAAICNTNSLSGVTYPIPDGSKSLLSPLVIAKSAHLLASIWKVSKLHGRGSLCGQFFSYSFMQLMNLALEAPKHGKILEDSVLERFGCLASEVTGVFFTWLSTNPGLALDMVFGMDKGSCNMYTSHIPQSDSPNSRGKNADDSGNESDASLLDIANLSRNTDQSKKTGDVSRKGSDVSLRQIGHSARDKPDLKKKGGDSGNESDVSLLAIAHLTDNDAEEAPKTVKIRKRHRRRRIRKNGDDSGSQSDTPVSVAHANDSGVETGRKVVKRRKRRRIKKKVIDSGNESGGSLIAKTHPTDGDAEAVPRKNRRRKRVRIMKNSDESDSDSDAIPLATTRPTGKRQAVASAESKRRHDNPVEKKVFDSGSEYGTSDC